MCMLFWKYIQWINIFMIYIYIYTVRCDCVSEYRNTNDHSFNLTESLAVGDLFAWWNDPSAAAMATAIAIRSYLNCAAFPVMPLSESWLPYHMTHQANIETAFGECPMFSGIHCSIGWASTTFTHWVIHPLGHSPVGSFTHGVIHPLGVVSAGHSRSFFTYRIKPEDLYILSCEKGRGRRPRPFSWLRMENPETSYLCNWLKIHPTWMRIPDNQQLGHTWLIIILEAYHDKWSVLDRR